MAADDERQSLMKAVMNHARRYAHDFHYIKNDEDWLKYEKEFFKRIKYVKSSDLGNSEWQMDNIILILDDIEEEINKKTE